MHSDGNQVVAVLSFSWPFLVWIVWTGWAKNSQRPLIVPKCVTILEIRRMNEVPDRSLGGRGWDVLRRSMNIFWPLSRRCRGVGWLNAVEPSLIVTMSVYEVKRSTAVYSLPRKWQNSEAKRVSSLEFALAFAFPRITIPKAMEVREGAAIQLPICRMNTHSSYHFKFRRLGNWLTKDPISRAVVKWSLGRVVFQSLWNSQPFECGQETEIFFTAGQLRNPEKRRLAILNFHVSSFYRTDGKTNE